MCVIYSSCKSDLNKYIEEQPKQLAQHQCVSSLIYVS
jgi:hypothetical protein